jgi:predicted AlkP superfamily phosphohydrolase/phosphomutase
LQKNSQKKILVIGLDSMPDTEVFEKRKDELPNLKKMIDNGIYGTLKSCHPPITVPAWRVMMSSKSPGELGIYGFRHRKGFSYNDGWFTTSLAVKDPMIWDIMEKHDKKSCLIGVPPSYPPFSVNGNLVSCFITPKDKTSGYTFPPELSDEINSVLDGKYLFDAKFRILDRDTILKDLLEMTEKRFEVLKHMIVTKPWDFFMFVEIGVDRLHHMFWKYYDKNHPRYEPNSKYQNTIPDYYKLIDNKIGELLELIDDDTYVITVSDHGITSMNGAFCINEWLIKEGYLVLKNYPKDITDVNHCDVDWEKTTAWGWGGYYARIFFNVKNREENGIISQEEFEDKKNELKKKILGITGPSGEKFENKVMYPEDLYDKANGSKPDMLVYFDNLHWRSAGTIGHNALYLSENDTGPDDAVHWWDGMFLIYNKNKSANGKRLEGLSIYDVSPIILNAMSIDVPTNMAGKVPNEISSWLND